MFENISRQLTEKSIQDNIITQEDAELYQFAFQALAVHLAGWGTMCLAGIVFGCLWETLLLMAMFIPLRIYAGGYHLGSYLKCYIVSSVVFAAVVFSCKMLRGILPPTIAIAAFAVGAVIVFLLAPIGDPNKPLDEKDAARSKKLTHGILLVESAVFAALAVFSFGERLLMFAAAAPVMVAMLLLVSQVKQPKSH